MSELRALYLFMFMATLFASPLATMAAAPTWAQDCRKAGEASTAACKMASDNATAADNAQGAANQSRFAGSSQIQNPSAALQQQGQQQAARLTAAKAKCDEEQRKCEQKCSQEEQDRASRAGGPPTDPIANMARAQAGQVEKNKQSACVAPISAMSSNLGSAASNASQAAQQASDTKGASNSGMPPPMPPPSGGGSSDEPEAEEPTQPDSLQVNCDDLGNSKYSDCNDHYISKCSGAMTAPGCEAFVSRYCKNTSATPLLTSDSLRTPATANLVANKQGEGLGSTFCSKANAYKYCQMAGRSECPSCKNLNSPWPTESTTALTDAQKSCPTDPMFLDPEVQAKLKATETTPTTGTVATQLDNPSGVKDRLATESTGAGGGGGSGGFSTQSAGAGGAGSAPKGAMAAGVPSGLNMDTGGGGGGAGGGSSNENGTSGPGYQPARVNGEARRAPTATMASEPRDVAQKFGPSIFSIQSTTYRDMCSRGRLLHCRR